MSNPKDLPRLRLNSTDDFDIRDSWGAAFTDEKLPIAQTNVDTALNTIETAVNSAQSQYEAVNGFFDANAGAITATVNIISEHVDLKVVETAISHFEEVAGVLVRGLDELSKLHPFVGVAVMAFKLVYTLDATRRENNKKVMVIKLQMKDMMVVLFQLRHVKDASEVGPDGTSIAGRMQTLMNDIAEEIKQCGSACDAYLKKGFFSKTFKSKIYADRLARWGDAFEGRKEDITFALTMHTAVGVDQANLKLDGVGDGVGRVEKKMDAILTLFQKFETPRETELMKFIDDNGGIQACLISDKLMHEMQKREGAGRQDLESYRKRIKKESEEDVDDVLKKNFDVFSRKLDLQSQQLDNLDDSIRVQGQQIISAFLAGSHDDIVHRDLKRIWQIGGWKGSVKARHFVLTLYDYYGEHQDEICESNVASPISAVPPKPLDSSADLPAIHLVAKMAIKGRRLKHSRWALNFVNVSHLQPIIEAIDDDGTGYVTIKECNTFATGRPQGWSLLHWIAYWASGWHLSLTQYQAKIHSVISQMFTAVKHVLPENRAACNPYLTSDPMSLIEKLLRSTRIRTPNDNKHAEEQLSMIVASYVDTEEKRLDDKLKALAYNIDLRSTVTLVTGPGRIERFLFPLLYLILRQHLKRIVLGATTVLDTNEFDAPMASLSNIFGFVQERVNDLEAIFKQTAHVVEKRLKHFAYGMFFVGYNEKDPGVTNLYCLDPPEDANEREDPLADERLEDTLEAHRMAARTIDPSILAESHEVDDEFRAFEVHNEVHSVYPRPDPLASSSALAEISQSRIEKEMMPCEELQGVWSTELIIWDSEYPTVRMGPTQIGFKFEDPSSRNYAITGIAQTTSGRYLVGGQYFPASHRIALKVTYFHGTEEILSLVLRGVVDFANDTIYGSWERFLAASPTPLLAEALSKEDFSFDSTPFQPFTLSRTPVEYYRYRIVPYRGVVTLARCRWRFALGAVIHMVRKTSWSWHYIREHCVIRRRYSKTRLEGLFLNGGAVEFSESMKRPDRLWDFRRLRPDVTPTDAQLWAHCAFGTSSTSSPLPSWDEETVERILDVAFDDPRDIGDTSQIGEEKTICASDVDFVANTKDANDISNDTTGTFDHWHGVWNGHFFYYEVTGELCGFQGLTQLRLAATSGTSADDSTEDPKTSLVIEGQNMHGSITSSTLALAHRSLNTAFVMPNGAKIDVNLEYEQRRGRLGGTWKLMSNGMPIGKTTFCVFTRTPSSLVKYRPMPDTAHVKQALYVPRKMAKERWAFLKQSILHLLRKRRWAWLYFKHRGDERRNFLEKLKRERMDLQSAFRPVDRAWHFNTDYLLHVYPSYLGHCTLAFLIKDYRILAQHEPYECDSCGGNIMTTRITCLECIKEDFSNSIDVCEPCSQDDCEGNGMKHLSSHPMLRCSRYLFPSRYMGAVEKGKNSWKEYKATFASAITQASSSRDQPASQHDLQTNQDVAIREASGAKKIARPECIYCDKIIEPPFWGCIDCSSEVYICTTCTDRHPDSIRPPAVSAHTWDHLLVRVWGVDEVELESPTEGRKSDVLMDTGERFSSLEARVAKAELTAQISTSPAPKYESLEVRMDGFESRLQRLEDSMGRMEGMLNLLVQAMASAGR